MKENELMIGDYIYQHHPKDNTPHIVKVSADTFDLMYRMEIGFIQEQSPLYRIIEPIPLTPEILEKNFYKKCVITNGMEIDIRFKPYHITEQLYVHNGMCGTMVCCSDGGNTLSPLFECKYVHQLQHILKASGILNEIVL